MTDRRPTPTSAEMHRIKVDFFHAANGKRASTVYYGLYGSLGVAEGALRMLGSQLDTIAGKGRWEATFQVAELKWGTAEADKAVSA